ncbi:precorrin-3B C17-methyltransferase [Desulfurispirillum indicum S5]|uniref:Precorrin-3B C17-methyltransferase n=1 Tax=Desulfurispirillum indicum (strain ATCC BAA-1389 / DSM 22839 / S5) TaxID=653733 RepID=E6W0S6_DESIS|nr:precorrin-3B C(17)-methyltransferase [Desulfurispirillum indicum]ADU66421.1 precorrin-3B C17-methyltransferase [Desulfurispirillum indicum S5]
MSEGILFVAGTGPGTSDYMAPAARAAIASATYICGYKPYLEQVSHLIPPGAQVFSNGMTGEKERVEKAIEAMEQGNRVALVCGGDASLYSLASLVHELATNTDAIEVIPGITAALAASARLGAPVADDLAIISMSDLLTPWELIRKRVEAVNSGDFVCAIYNPRSKKRTTQLAHTVERFMTERGDLACGYVRHCYREGESTWTGHLSALDLEVIDMSTVVMVGSTRTRLKNGKLVTPRGYTAKYGERP